MPGGISQKINKWAVFSYQTALLHLYGHEFFQKTQIFNFNYSLGKFSRRQIDDILFFFFQKIGFDLSCKLSPYVFSGKYEKKDILKCCLLKFFTQHARY